MRAATRSFLYALGEDDDDIVRPHIAVIHTGGEMSPCNTSLREQALQARAGIYANGGTPHECPVVSVSDGLSIAHPEMRCSLVSREIIADSVEATVQAHQWDGIFARRFPAKSAARKSTLSIHEMIGKVLAGDATPAELDAITRGCLPTAGARAGQYTANTMAMGAEALGLSLLGSSMIPAVFSERPPMVQRAGKMLMRAVMEQ